MAEIVYRDRETIVSNTLYTDGLIETVTVGELVRCKDCVNWIPGYITDTDDLIPPKCGKYHQMVGHSSDDFCSLAERKDGEQHG